MNREKQIEEMAKITCQMYRRDKEKKCAGVQECDMKCLHYQRCEALYNAGYRKTSDIAREIFEELKSAGLSELRYPIIAELKKKYTEEGK